MEKIKRNTPEHVAAIDERRAVLLNHCEYITVHDKFFGKEWLEITGFAVKFVYNWSKGWHICFENHEEAMLFSLATGLRFVTREDQRF